MMTILKQFVRSRIDSLVVAPLRGLFTEVIYQQIFERACADAGVRNTFYPVGPAANYTLLYLLFRVIRENRLETIVELGSGQSTILIDRIKPAGTRHVCYEDDPDWFDRVRPDLTDTDYRLRGLTSVEIEGRVHRWYSDVEPTDFDLLLVDGPWGTRHWSRVGCVPLIERNTRRDFVIIFDDSNRPGEAETVSYVLERLRRRDPDVIARSLRGTKRQTVIACGKYRAAAFYF